MCPLARTTCAGLCRDKLKLAGPIEDRDLPRCLSYKGVKEEVEGEARNKTNVDLFRDTYKSTVVPAHFTASQVSGIFEDFCYRGKRVRGGVSLEEASKDWLDAHRLHSDLTGKVISEQTKCSLSFDYVRRYLFVQVCFQLQEKTDEHLTHLQRGLQGIKLYQLQEGPPDEGCSTCLPVSTTCCRILSTPLLDRERGTGEQRPLTRSWKSIFSSRRSEDWTPL